MRRRMIFALAAFIFMGAQQPSHAMPSEWVPYKFGSCTGRFTDGNEWGGVYSRIFKSVAEIEDIEKSFRAQVKAEFPNFDTSTGNCEIIAQATKESAQKERNRLLKAVPNNRTSQFTY